MFWKVSPSTLSLRKLYVGTIIRSYSTCLSNMSALKTANNGLPLKEVVDALNKFADTSLAASWDNVGLLIEPTKPKSVSHILLTNDLTEDVVIEAVEFKSDLIISYHPPIFVPLKSITTRTWKERIAATCLENKIAVYSPHTAFDSIKGGVNDWLVSAFSKVLNKSTPIQPEENNPENGIGRLCTLKEQIHIDEAVRLVKQLTGLNHVRLACARGIPHTDAFVKSIAICAGAGTSVLKDLQADLYLTGEMLHHDILDAVHRGIHVILTNHSDSERGFLKNFALTLSNMLNNSVSVTVSTKDTDPLKTV